MKKIMVAIVGLSIVLLADFSRSSEGIVTDNTTTLQWQDDYSDNGGSVKNTTWEAAIDYCEALTLGGHDDWRLPNFNELYSIADHTKRNPAIDTTFQTVVSRLYWSSTSFVGDENIAWAVGFYRGGGYWGHKDDENYYILCVRDGQ